MSAGVLLVPLSLGAGFKLVKDGAEAEPLRGKVEPAAFPKSLFPCNPTCCPARSGIYCNVWDREVRQHEYMQVGWELPDERWGGFGRCEDWRSCIEVSGGQPLYAARRRLERWRSLLLNSI